MKFTTRIFSAFVAFIMVFQSATVAFGATKKSAYTGLTYTQNSQFDDYTIINGIDVSEHNGSIDFEKVADDGIDYVIIRAGYGSYTSQEDEYFETNYKNAKAAGLKVGAYWYSYATQLSATSSQYKSIENEIKACKTVIEGKTFDLPVFFDLEENDQFKKGSTFCTNAVKEFTAGIENAGYESGLYMSRSPLNSYINESVRDSTTLWVAEYNTKNNYSGNYLMWQYSSKGSVNGVSGNCDVNFMYENIKVNDIANKKYTGSAITPKVTAYFNGTLLKEGTDYTLSYSNNTDVGKAKIKITATDTAEFTGTKTVYFNIVPNDVTNLKPTSKSITTLSYSWTKSTGADGYIVTTTNKSNGVAVKNYTTTNSIKITGLNGGTNYATKVKPYFLNGSVKVYGSYCSEVEKITKPAQISGLKVSSRTTSSITLKWNKQPNVNGYKIYKYVESTKSYKYVTKITGANNNTYKITGLNAGSKVKYKVRAYLTQGTTLYNGETTKIVACSKPATPRLKSAINISNRKITAKWKTVSLATGYEVQCSKSSSFSSGNKNVYVSGKNTSTKSFTSSSTGTYYVRVRAYITIDSKKYYGAWSDKIKVKVK